MRSFIKSLSFGFALCTVLVSTSALADDTASVRDTGNGDYTYEFFDDPLAAEGIAPGGGTIHVVKRQVRTLLIRPRTQFVTEMLKSVENL